MFGFSNKIITKINYHQQQQEQRAQQQTNSDAFIHTYGTNGSHRSIRIPISILNRWKTVPTQIIKFCLFESFKTKCQPI